MDILESILQILAICIGSIVGLLSLVLFIRFQWPAPMQWLLKLFVSALSPVFVAISLPCIMIGMATGSILATAIGLYALLVFLIHIISVTRKPDSATGFESAFGANWENRIAPGQKLQFLRNRLVLKLPNVADAKFERNIPFATIPGTARQLFCDLWQPPDNVSRSGLAFIYLFGSAWYILDKDLGTRPFFRHLANQGHVIMDVAYRLAPETDLMGMIHDVKRAIAWMKDHATTYGINPDRIVLGGGSAGAHLALMSAYTSNALAFIPKEMQATDCSVRAVISLYGPANLQAMYYHTNQHITTRRTQNMPKKVARMQMPAWITKKMGTDYHRLGFDKNLDNVGSFLSLFGGHPDECPDRYALFSPDTHVHADCPPTLLIHGEHDVMAPVNSTCDLHARLLASGVPTVMHILPQTDHAFDLILPRISPSAHHAMYDVERFLARMAMKDE